jgi:hypothetical protein
VPICWLVVGHAGTGAIHHSYCVIIMAMILYNVYMFSYFEMNISFGIKPSISASSLDPMKIPAPQICNKTIDASRVNEASRL